MTAFLTTVLAVLTVNIVVAVVATVRRPHHERWLLAVLLVGTAGAGIVAVSSVLAGADGRRFLDVALVLVALALVSTAVRRHRWTDHPRSSPSSTSAGNGPTGAR